MHVYVAHVDRLLSKIHDQRTFAEAEIPFALYEGTISSCQDYVGRDRCATERRMFGLLAGKEREHCFNVSCIFIRCGSCGQKTAGERPEDVCHVCGAEIPSDAKGGLGLGELVVAYEALRDGRAGGTKMTEFGMVTPTLALRGRTHGIPGLSAAAFGTNRFELEVPSDEDDWPAARVPSEELLKIISTPRYTTWQGENWLFHCSKAMTFVGEPPSEELKRWRLDADAATELSALEEQMGELDSGLMTFRCVVCGEHRFHLDLD